MMKSKKYLLTIIVLLLFNFINVDASELSITSIECTTTGEATLLRSNGKNLLMDTCDEDKEGYTNRVLNYLEENNINDFDIYLSHYHVDHFGQIRKLLTKADNHQITIKNIYFPDFTAITNSGCTNCVGITELYNDVKNWCEANNVNFVILKKNSTFTIGDATVDVIGPVGSYTINQFGTEDGTQIGHFLNNNSLVSLVTVGKTRFLTAGDIEKEEEQNLLNSNINLSADIFKLSHHAHKLSNTEAFINAINPKYVFFSNMDTGYNSFETTAEVINYVQTKSNVYSRSYNGDITFNIKDDNITVLPTKNYKTLTIKYTDFETGEIIGSVDYKFTTTPTGTYYHLFDYIKDIPGYKYDENNNAITPSGNLDNDKEIKIYYRKTVSKDENVKVPNTFKSNSKVLLFVSLIFIITGTLIIINILKQNKKTNE